MLFPYKGRNEEWQGFGDPSTLSAEHTMLTSWHLSVKGFFLLCATVPAHEVTRPHTYTQGF